MHKPYFLLAAAGAAASLSASPAWADVYAAPNEAGTGRVILLEPLTFVKIDDLDFGGFIIPSVGSDTVTIDAASGTATNGATLTQLPQFVQQRGHFMGAGTPNQAVTVVATLPTRLYLGGNLASPTSIPVSLELDVAPDVSGNHSYTIASDQTLDVYVGGDIVIDSSMSPGIYSNVYELTATYQ